ncbi:4'-phosphopantetheinyl transferase superfamily protein [Micromonospora sp. WMMD714]|uniref:4'-phosphopantetheinyl transferase family protein n=1 Tax=Micromonospora sp. WMMD714 TaxID=3016097 RepID=UPI00249B6749|nr:4'-phosphopantetheinyl transferase superfamily protein [Micromonospora sp. WMMD714]WFE65082.1 4'-phosphopantetheinyl transferase superfamily protein [Micromonospora sp. WMMD714]
MGERLGGDECLIWRCPVGPVPERLSALLDDAERARARALGHEQARARFVTGRVTARLLAARHADTDPRDVVFSSTCRHCAGPHGRLEVHTRTGVLHVSVSHSAARVVVAIARDTVCGVDIERVALRGDRIPVSALSPAERRVLDGLPEQRRLAGFIRYWTRKEAVLKATGDGLVLSPADLTVSAPDAPASLLSWANRPPPHVEVHLSDLAVGDGYRGALATLGRPLTVVECDVDPCEKASRL